MKTSSSLDRFRESLRLQQVFNTFVRYGMDVLLDRGLIGDFRRFMQNWVYDPPQPLLPLSTPVKVRLMIEELGPIYVKMGQIVSSQAQALPAEWGQELKKLQSNVPPFPTQQVREIITAELGAPPELLFADFDPNPLAAASTAQVHRATLPFGQSVVVKVQRPHIQRQVRADLGIMRNAVRVFTRRSTWVRDLDLRGMLDVFGNNILIELDYGYEAYHAYRLSQNLEGIEGCRVPHIYQEFSTSKVLTMEFINGVKISDLAAIEAAGLDKQLLAEHTLHSMVKQLLIDGFFHSDPHPGNLLVNLQTGEINFLDLGMVGELDVRQRVNLINLFMTLNQMDTPGLAQVLLSISKPFRKVDEAAYYRDFERRVGRYLEYDTRSSFGQIVSVGLDLLQEHGLRLDSQLTLALKSLMQAEAITRLLVPREDIVGLINKHIQQLMLAQINEENIKKVVTKEGTYLLRELVQRMPSLRDAAFSWLEQYQAGQFNLKLDTSDLSKDIQSVRNLGRQIIIGVMLIGMIIGSSIAISISESSGGPSSLLPQIAFIGYVGSMVVAGLFVVVLLWRLWLGEEPD
ncbi:MAG: AarF/ABC1/UbiB kinase family protein [Anaerolineae bacterium]|nr:AarF/ABC1/UbiB kinase family protein [Anaerolineae bacterium]